MKKKSIFNNNEVDIDLLVNQPKHIRKMLGQKKDEDEEYENETEEEGDEEDKNKSLSPQMKQYINDFIDSKKVKKKEKPKAAFDSIIEKVYKTGDKYFKEQTEEHPKHKGYPKSALFDASKKYGDFIHKHNKEADENAQKHKGEGIIENYLKKLKK